MLATRPVDSVPWRAVALVALVGIAYHYSLATLARGLSLQTPLAYLAIVPVVALGLAAVQLGRLAPERPIHDRQVDYIVGLGLIAGAVALIVMLPDSLASRFWLYRMDLVSLPLFVAGLVSLLFGVRRLWSIRAPIAFLLLAWPLPYTPLLGDWLVASTELTAGAVAVLNRLVPIAEMSPSDPTVFFVGEGLGAFAVSVGSACAGVNSVVGFVLLGSALAVVLRGSRLRRLAWLGAGIVVIWLLNVVRIEAIFLVGHLFGRSAALDILHPLAGLVVFNVGLLGMLAVTPRLGLRLGEPAAGGVPAGEPRKAVSRISGALALAVVICLPVAVLNAGLSRFEAIATPLGEARRDASFDLETAQLPGWEASFMASNPAARQFFGDGARWDRLQYVSTATAGIRSSVPVYLDVIDTDDPNALLAYGLEVCYAFHAYRIESVATADLGAGVTGQVIDYHNRTIGADWSAIAWEWPYQSGGRTWYERIVLLVPDGPRATFAGAETIEVATQADRFRSTDRFLVAMAREIVQGQLREDGS